MVKYKLLARAKSSQLVLVHRHSVALIRMGPWITILPRPPNERHHTRTQQSHTTASASPTPLSLSSAGRTQSPRSRQSGPRLLARMSHPPLASQRACVAVMSRRTRDERAKWGSGDVTRNQTPVPAGCAGGNGRYPSPAPPSRLRDFLVAAGRQAVPPTISAHLAPSVNRAKFVTPVAVVLPQSQPDKDSLLIFAVVALALLLVCSICAVLWMAVRCWRTRKERRTVVSLSDLRAIDAGGPGVRITIATAAAAVPGGSRGGWSLVRWMSGRAG